MIALYKNVLKIILILKLHKNFSIKKKNKMKKKLSDEMLLIKKNI